MAREKFAPQNIRPKSAVEFGFDGVGENLPDVGTKLRSKIFIKARRAILTNPMVGDLEKYLKNKQVKAKRKILDETKI